MGNKQERHYGLEITSNSKVGSAFSLPRSKTCIFKTPTCAKACYGNGIRYQSARQKQKRERNFRTVEFLLDQGGPQALAKNLAILVDLARPIDWIASTIIGIETEIPWTFRIHDVGDFHSVAYAEAWLIAMKERPACSFWFYTRSFIEKPLFDTLTKLASEPNCKGWLSLDQENFAEGLIRYCESPAGTWKMALLQEQEELLPVEIVPYLSIFSKPGDLLSFPKHHGGRHVQPVKAENLTICPQVTGTYKLETNRELPKPCQACRFCLP